MNNLPVGSENDSNAPWNNETGFTCSVCDKKINNEGICNSKACFKADNM